MNLSFPVGWLDHESNQKVLILHFDDIKMHATVGWNTEDSVFKLLIEQFPQRLKLFSFKYRISVQLLDRLTEMPIVGGKTLMSPYYPYRPFDQCMIHQEHSLDSLSVYGSHVKFGEIYEIGILINIEIAKHHMSIPLEDCRTGCNTAYEFWNGTSCFVDDRMLKFHIHDSYILLQFNRYCSAKEEYDLSVRTIKCEDDYSSFLPFFYLIFGWPLDLSGVSDDVITKLARLITRHGVWHLFRSIRAADDIKLKLFREMRQIFSSEKPKHVVFKLAKSKEKDIPGRQLLGTIDVETFSCETYAEYKRMCLSDEYSDVLFEQPSLTFIPEEGRLFDCFVNDRRCMGPDVTVNGRELFCHRSIRTERGRTKGYFKITDFVKVDLTHPSVSTTEITLDNRTYHVPTCFIRENMNGELQAVSQTTSCTLLLRFLVGMHPEIGDIDLLVDATIAAIKAGMMHIANELEEQICSTGWNAIKDKDYQSIAGLITKLQENDCPRSIHYILSQLDQTSVSRFIASFPGVDPEIIASFVSDKKTIDDCGWTRFNKHELCKPKLDKVKKLTKNLDFDQLKEEVDKLINSDKLKREETEYMKKIAEEYHERLLTDPKKKKYRHFY